jgi:cell cycle checkpoint control protein RAD9A
MNTQEVFHAGMDKSLSQNVIRCQARMFKQYLEHMSAKAEEFSFTFKEDHVQLCSFTTGVHYDQEILRHPLQTTVAMNRDEFECIRVSLGANISVRMKELRTFISMADSMGPTTTIEANFYRPGWPLMFEILGQKDGGLTFLFTTSVNASMDDAEPGRGQDGTSLKMTKNVSLLQQAERTAQDATQYEGDDNQVPTVTWNGGNENAEHDGTTGTQYKSTAHGHTSLFVADVEDEDSDEGVVRALDEYEAIGPTQNMSQAKGLFD